MTRSSGGILLIVATVAVCVAVIAAISMLESPATQREQRLDSMRVEDLASVERLVGSFVGVHKELPPDLASLAREPGYSVRINDPESGAPYDYRTMGADSYLLCAIFKTSTSDAAPRNAYGQTPGTTWAHGIGRQCFTRHVDLRARHQDEAH